MNLNNFPAGSTVVEHPKWGRCLKMPDGVFVKPNGSIESELPTHREVTLFERLELPMTDDQGNPRFDHYNGLPLMRVVRGKEVGKAQVKYGPAPGFGIPLAIAVNGVVYEKINDDLFIQAQQ